MFVEKNCRKESPWCIHVSLEQGLQHRNGIYLWRITMRRITIVAAIIQHAVRETLIRLSFSGLSVFPQFGQ
jgi:hypothetical protein